LMDASPIGDGSAAAILVPLENLGHDPKPTVIKVIGSAAATDCISVHNREHPTWLKAAEISSKQAYQQAHVEAKDIQFFELHDAFSIMAALSLEAIATRGGLKARGHPVGATGMYQIVEVVQQLRGECGETQIADARIGMAQNIGGSGSNIITHILKR
jgi:acetyl-CoA C-acetyltransferase